MTDVLLVCGMQQTDVNRLSEGATVPVIDVFSDLFSMVKAMSDLFTLLEVGGPLKGKSLAWVGPPTSLCNTYLFFAPKLKLNMKLACVCPVSDTAAAI